MCVSTEGRLQAEVRKHGRAKALLLTEVAALRGRLGVTSAQLPSSRPTSSSHVLLPPVAAMGSEVPMLQSDGLPYLLEGGWCASVPSPPPPPHPLSPLIREVEKVLSEALQCAVEADEREEALSSMVLSLTLRISLLVIHHHSLSQRWWSGATTAKGRWTVARS